MALIQDPDTGDSVKIEAASKAMRVITVDESGNATTQSSPLPVYSTAIFITPTTLTDGSVFFSLYNPGDSTKKLYLERIDLNYSFVGTAAASRSVFRGTQSTGVPAGGTPVNAFEHAGSASPSIAVIQQGNTALTGVAIGSKRLFNFGGSNQLNTMVNDQIVLVKPIVLAPGAGFSISADGAVIAGCGLMGIIQWREGA